MILRVVVFYGLMAFLLVFIGGVQQEVGLPEDLLFLFQWAPGIAGLTMLNNVGIHGFDYLTAIDFNMPEEARDGTETLAYSHRLNTGFAPRNYKRDLRAISQPLLVVAGTDDEAFYAEQYEPVISQYTEARVELLDGVGHMGAVVDPSVQPVVGTWLEGLGILP
jgi:pimeloyl-ACP methyl ester carboxylesterase